MITACMLSTIAIFVVGARLYARFHITKAPGIDDFLIVLALVFGIATSILIMVGNQIYYSGYHVWVSTHPVTAWLHLTNTRTSHPEMQSPTESTFGLRNYATPSPSPASRSASSSSTAASASPSHAPSSSPYGSASSTTPSTACPSSSPYA